MAKREKFESSRNKGVTRHISENTPGNMSLKLALCFFVSGTKIRGASALRAGEGMTEAQN